MSPPEEAGTARDAARRGGLTSSRLFCWQGKEKVNPSGSDTPFIPMYSRKSEMQWTMWSKSWTSKDKGSSYHHSQSPAGSQISGDSDPLPGLLQCSNRSQNFEWSGTWELSNPNKLSSPSSHPQRGQIPASPPPKGPWRAGGQQGGDTGTQSLCKGSPEPSSPVCWGHSQSPGTAWRALQNSFQMSHCLCCGFPI